jgi:hypothetical protein
LQCSNLVLIGDEPLQLLKARITAAELQNVAAEETSDEERKDRESERPVCLALLAPSSSMERQK